MIIPANEENIALYYAETEHYSQSTLKCFLSPATFDKYLDNLLLNKPTEDLYYSEKEAMIVGQGADTYYTRGKEVFYDNYYVAQIELPGPKVMSICQYVFDEVLSLFRTETITEVSTDFVTYTDIILRGIEKENYYPTYKTETRVSKVIEEGKLYFSMLVASEGKQVINEETEKLIIKVADLYSKAVTKFLEDKNITNFTLTFQHDIYSRGKKGLLDILIRDETTDYYYVIDLKYTSDYLSHFYSKIKNFRYDIQLSFYRNLCYEKLSSSPEMYIVVVSGKSFSTQTIKFEKELLTIGELGNSEQRNYLRVVAVSNDIEENDCIELKLPFIQGYRQLENLYEEFWEQKKNCKTEEEILSLRSFLDTIVPIVNTEVFYNL